MFKNVKCDRKQLIRNLVFCAIIIVSIWVISYLGSYIGYSILALGANVFALAASGNL